MRATAFAIAVTLSAAALAAPAAAELTLVYRVTQTQVSSAKDGAARVERTSSDVTVGLGAHYLYELGSPHPQQIDFQRRIVRAMDDTLHIYVEAPLVAIAEYREMEITSRAAMRAAFASFKPNAPALGSILDDEAELGMRSPQRKKSDPLPAADAGTNPRTWRFAGDTATVCAFTDTTLDDAQHSMLEHYLLYACHLHPDVRAALLQPRRLPRRLQYRWSLLGTTTTVEMTLVSMKVAADAPPSSPLGFTRKAAYDSALVAVFDSSAAGIGGCRAAAADVYALLEGGKRAAAEGRPLDALLAASEYSLMTCSDPPAFDPRTQDLIRKDARAKRFSEAVDRISRNKLAEGQRLLDAIDETGIAKHYMIDLERATIDARSGRSRAAVTHFQEALRANPCLVGAWTDMASVYRMEFDTVDGWVCVEAARQVAPAACPMLKPLEERERELMARHPEYF